MVRMLAFSATLLMLAIAPTPSPAYWVGTEAQPSCAAGSGGTVVGDCYRNVEAGRRQNNLWPQQFVEADRVRAKEPFDLMVRNGWRRQNLVGSHHFNSNSDGLTESGKLRVQWILTQAPMQYRQVYIERSINNGVTEKRRAAVEQFAQQVVGEGYAVQETTMLTDGRPATVVDYVNTAFRANMPVPQLPESLYKGIEGE